MIIKLEKSQKYCEKLQSALERRIHEVHALKKENKQNSTRKAQLEKKLVDLENMATEMNKQKAELMHYKENSERKSTEMLITLNRENDTVRILLYLDFNRLISFEGLVIFHSSLFE